jgi:hypothetical protein
MRTTAILIFFFAAHYVVTAQANLGTNEAPKPTSLINSEAKESAVETENGLIERIAIDPSLKLTPQQFYIINEVPVSKEVYMEFLRQKEIELNTPNSEK